RVRPRRHHRPGGPKVLVSCPARSGPARLQYHAAVTTSAELCSRCRADVHQGCSTGRLFAGEIAPSKGKACNSVVPTRRCPGRCAAASLWLPSSPPRWLLRLPPRRSPDPRPPLPSIRGCSRRCSGAASGRIAADGRWPSPGSPLTDQTPISSVGALAVAASDHNVIYVGTGEAAPRGDMPYGDGVYKSVD